MLTDKKEKKEKMVETIIGPETVIEGKIKLPTSLRIDGKIYGEVECQGDIFIGKDGYVEPTIKAKNINIAGEVRGDLYTTEKVYVQPKGKLIGSATSKGIVIDDGGIFSGESTIVEDEKDVKSKKKDTKNNNKKDKQVANY
ncbi:polymer-forming cytoskeletal protein [Virgibacillus byunsanensis]|uniref:Polymer-forming cytoskeletal protein n=1 Tax=Virgibacillus byunsanensis TaxID=570945 RepID=A0ABW3LLN1_9BACI